MATVVPLGTVVFTATALELAKEKDINLVALVLNHRMGNWGDVCAADKKTNDWALANGARILSAYKVKEEKFWVITDAERTSTCVMLPEDY